MSSEKWDDKRVDVTKLSLDLQNPRVPKHIKDRGDLVEIRNYLVESENVLKIARSIANNGYHRSAVAIVCEENGKLVVLDGNRRLAACQLLLDPVLAVNQKDKKELEELSKKMDRQQLTDVKITVAPSRKSAEKEIWNIHVNSGLLKPWEVLQKIRMYQNLIDTKAFTVDSAAVDYGIGKGAFKSELAKLFFHEHISERLSDPVEQDELLKSGFNKIDRLILSRNGRKFLEYEVEDDGKIKVQNEKIFKKKLDEIIPYVVDHNKITPQASQQDLERSVFSVLDPKKFPISGPAAKVTKHLTSLKKPAPSGTLASNGWITWREYTAYQGAQRVKQLLEELVSLDHENKKNVSIISLRVLLELSLYHKLESKGYIKQMQREYSTLIRTKNVVRLAANKPLLVPEKNWSPTFREMLDFSIDPKRNVIADPLARSALQRIVSGSVNFVDDLNAFIHNVNYIPPKGESEKIWSQFGRILFDTISKIN